jgi:hypothetical protein
MKDRKEMEETAKHWALQYFWEHSPCPAKPLHADSFSMPEHCDVLSAAHMGGSNKIHVGGRSRPCTALPSWVRAVPGVAQQTTRARGTRQRDREHGEQHQVGGHHGDMCRHGLDRRCSPREPIRTQHSTTTGQSADRKRTGWATKSIRLHLRTQVEPSAIDI